MPQVNPDLYDFLKENETGLYTRNYKNDKTVYAYVHIYFFRLQEFVDIVGSYPFEEGGADVKMFESTVCVDLNDIIEGKGHELLDYKNCFNEYDWNHYEEQIIEMYK
jgi:hypothetical protein